MQEQIWAGGSQSLKERNGFLLDEVLTEEPSQERHMAQEDEVPRNQGPIKQINKCQLRLSFHTTFLTYAACSLSVVSVHSFFLFTTSTLYLRTKVCYTNLFSVGS